MHCEMTHRVKTLFCEQGDENSGSTKGRKFPVFLNNYHSHRRILFNAVKRGNCLIFKNSDLRSSGILRSVEW